MAAAKGDPGTWEPPPRMMMVATAAAFSAATTIALLIGECDIGGILAAIAFVFGLIGGVDLAVWSSKVYMTRSGAAKGDPGSWEPPPTALLLDTGGTAALLAALFAVLQERCPLATVLAVTALVLLLLALLQLRPQGSGRRDGGQTIR